MPTLQQPIWCNLSLRNVQHSVASLTLVRPSTEFIFDGLVLAGDYTQSDYPATLETAVRSGSYSGTIIESLSRLAATRLCDNSVNSPILRKDCFLN